MKRGASTPVLGEAAESFKDKKITIPNQFPWFTCSILILCVFIEFYANRWLPSTLGKGPLGIDKFSVVNAKSYLKQLTSLGPRITGSHTTEVLTPRFLMEALNKIRDAAPSNVLIELDEQHPSSNFHINFLGGITNVYDGVTNVVAKISWKDSKFPPSSAEAILINAHFDSVPGSPGGSDDGIGVACMLEALRAMSQGPSLGRPVIFLFNGAEEGNHQAAHGFISLHKWAPQVKFLINLEAIGAGGYEMVFQCNSGWLASHYRKHAPYPHTQVVAHELFKNFLYRVASTDWSTIIKYGTPGMMGIDSAYIENGYVYHTTFDTAEIIPDGTYLNTGDNILQVSRSLSTAVEVPSFGPIDTSAKSGTIALNRFEDENAVFVDFLGMEMFVYSGVYVTLFHSAAVLFGLLTVWKLSQHVKPPTWECIVAILFDEFLGIWGPALLTGLAGVLMYVVCPMRWYAGGVTCGILVYAPVAMFNTILVRAHLTTRSHSSYIMRQIACILMMSLITVPFILLNIMSAYVFCLWVVFVSLASLVQLQVRLYYAQHYPAHLSPAMAPEGGSYPHAIKTFGSFTSTSNLAHSQSNGNVPMRRSASNGSLVDADCQTSTLAMINHHAGRYLYSPEFFYQCAISPMILLWVQTIHLTFVLIIPLLGKAGTTAPADPILGLLFGLLIALPSGCILMNDIQKPLQKGTIQSMIGCLLVGFVVLNVLYTNPYSDLRPKRLWIQHVERHTVQHDTSGDALFTPSLVDYGLWVSAFDSNGMAPISNMRALQVARDQHRDTECSNWSGDCYFDFPWVFPVADALKDSVYVPTADRPLVPEGQRLRTGVTSEQLSNALCARSSCSAPLQALVDENLYVHRVIRVTISGPSHMNLVVRDNARGERLAYWKINGAANLQDMVVPPASRYEGVHYLTLGFGLCPADRCEASLTLVVRGAEKVDIAGYGHYMDVTDNKEVRSFIGQLPSWSRGAEWTNYPSIIIRDSV